MPFCIQLVNQTHAFLKPGYESIKHDREEMNDLTKTNFIMSELCQALGYMSVLNVWSHQIYPKEIFYDRLENFFYEIIAKNCWLDSNKKDEPRRPSEMNDFIGICMRILLSLGNYSIFISVYNIKMK